MSALLNTDWQLHIAQSASPLFLQDERIAIVRMYSQALVTPLHDMLNYIFRQRRLQINERTLRSVIGIVVFLTGISPIHLRFVFISKNVPVLYYNPLVEDKKEQIERFLDYFKFYGILIDLEIETEVSLIT